MDRIAQPIGVVFRDDDSMSSQAGQAETCLNLSRSQDGLGEVALLDLINETSSRIERLRRANLGGLQHEYLHEMERYNIIANGFSEGCFEGIVLEFKHAIHEERSRVKTIQLYMRDLDELRGKLLDHCAVGSPYCDFVLETYHSYDGLIQQAEEVVSEIKAGIEVFECDLKFYSRGDGDE